MNRQKTCKCMRRGVEIVGEVFGCGDWSEWEGVGGFKALPKIRRLLRNERCNCSAKDAEIERLRAELAAAKRLAADALAAKDKAERESKKWMERWEEVCERS